MAMLYINRESDATVRRMLRPSFLLSGADTTVKADEPANGCSTVRKGDASDQDGLEHPSEPRRAKG